MARSDPTVTVMMSAYNYAGFIGRSLDSAFAQDYPPQLLDLVIVDDGSTDATPDVLAEYQARYPGRITVIRQPNAGYVAATNVAAAAAGGELLAVLDADDLWPAHKTRLQVARLLEDDAVGLVYCDTEVIDRYDTVRRRSLWEQLEITPQRGPGAFAQIMAGPGNIALSSTLMFRAELADQVFPIPSRAPYQDWWVTARIAAIAEIDWVDGVRVGYREHGENMTFGATGMSRVRESLKSAEARRQLLIHGAASHLDEKQLLAAWRAWEGAAITAVSQAQSAYVPLHVVTDEDRALAAGHAAAATAATLAGDVRAALRERINAVACDPFDSTSREWLHDLAWVAKIEHGPALTSDPLARARRFVTLAYFEELVAEPQLLSAYAAAFAEDDDATLAVAAIGLSDDRALAGITTLAARVGLDLSCLPDVLLVTGGGPAERVELERRADAVLTRRAAKLRAPAFRPEQITELHDLSRGELVAAAMAAESCG